jgi:hypothetical protein
MAGNKKIEPCLVTGWHTGNGDVKFLVRKDETFEPDPGKAGKFQGTALLLALPFHRFDH